MVQPGQPNDVSVEFEVEEPHNNLYLVIGAVGESGSIDKVTIIYNGYETISIDVELKPNYSITYRGDNKIMVYDEKGRMKNRIELDLEGIEMVRGSNNLRISADFSDNADLKLEGYVRIKDRVDVIHVK